MCFKRKVNVKEFELKNELDTIKQENEALRNEIEELKRLRRDNENLQNELEVTKNLYKNSINEICEIYNSLKFNEELIKRYRDEKYELTKRVEFCACILNELNPNIRLNALKELKNTLDLSIPFQEELE